MSSLDHSTRSGRDGLPPVVRTTEGATEGIYGLILAMSVIAVSAEHDPSDAGRVAAAVLVTALVFWLAHVYAHLLGFGVSEERRLTRAEFARGLRDHWSLVAVVVPLVFLLLLGAIGVLPDQASIVAATVSALVELAAAGGFAAIRRGAGPLGTTVSAAIAAALGLVIVLLKALLH